MPDRTASSDRVALMVLGGALGLAALTVLVQWLAPAAPTPPAAAGTALPRIPAPPAAGAGPIRALGVGSLTWYASLLSAPLFLAVSRGADRRGWRAPAVVGLFLVAAGAMAVSATALQYRLTFAAAPVAPGLGPWIRAGWATGVLPFLAVGAAVRATDLGFRLRDRDVRAARAEARAAEARLAALSARLQPHFLFNTLQGISTLIRRDPDAADAMLGHLADLLREILRHRDRPWVTLAHEIEALEPYLALARARYGERLDLVVTLAPEARTRLVPFFILQPLVENALEHGVARGPRPVRVELSAAIRDDAVLLTVRDDGPGEGASGGSGTGLADVRARLRELYGGAAALEAGPGPDLGWTARLSLPHPPGVS